jgi:MoaA/NifB/PqqE/SkfB family radical SAM enzyme
MSKKIQTHSPYIQYQRPDDGLPWFVNVIVTTLCNLRCAMCQSWENNESLGPRNEVLGFFDRLADWLPSPRMVILTGGEPLIHPDIFEYIDRLSSLGFIPALNSNGVALSIETVQKLEKSGLRVINLSLDGLEETHDKNRNGPGCFRGVLDMIHFISQSTDFAISVVTVINSQNAKELPALVRMLAEMGIAGIQFQAIVPTLAKPWSDEFFKTDPLWPDSDEKIADLHQCIDELCKLKSDGYPINNPPSQMLRWKRYFLDPNTLFSGETCDVAQNNLLIRADGAIQFCNHYGTLGTIKDDPKTLWKSELAIKMRREMEKCERPCNFFVNCCYIENDD